DYGPRRGSDRESTPAPGTRVSECPKGGDGGEGRGSEQGAPHPAGRIQQPLQACRGGAEQRHRMAALGVGNDPVHGGSRYEPPRPRPARGVTLFPHALTLEVRLLAMVPASPGGGPVPRLPGRKTDRKVNAYSENGTTACVSCGVGSACRGRCPPTAFCRYGGRLLVADQANSGHVEAASARAVPETVHKTCGNAVVMTRNGARRAVTWSRMPLPPGPVGLH